MAALLGDQINLSVNAYGVIGQYIETGDLKILGCLATERSETYADVPTAVDQGVDLSYDLIYNLLAPKGTDPAIIEKMSEACQRSSRRTPAMPRPSPPPMVRSPST